MSVWSSLKFNTMAAVVSTVSSFHQTKIFKDSPDLQYCNNRPTSIYVHMAKRIAMQTLEYEAHKLASKWLDNWTGGSARKRLVEQNAARIKQNRIELINHQEVQKNEWGKIRLSDQNHVVYATNKCGDLVREAMILYYDDEKEKLTFTDFAQDANEDLNLRKTETLTTKTWFHIDLAPDISVQSSKNIVLTQVQGRDYTRKELVSGGDLSFSVSGNIVSNEDKVYPTEAVKKFVKMMQYNGIINVKSFQFNNLNVDRIVIQDFKLGTPNYLNIQPYSFSCVAIEPDEDIVVVNDTIAQVNNMIEERVHTQSLDFVSILKQKALELATDAALESVSLGLDALTKNI